VKIWSNLDARVQRDWELRVHNSILVHHLDGGYGPNLASNVKLIKDDLQGEFDEPNST
jgi:hypothetical protein